MRKNSYPSGGLLFGLAPALFVCQDTTRAIESWWVARF